ncbi:MAG: hypothetical protein ACK40L_09040 [Hydrogenophaga sp.]
MADQIILGVHSNVRKDQIDPDTGNPYGIDAGHAWISVSRNGNTTRYGLWPDAHPNVEDNGDGSDIRVGMEDGDTPAASRYYQLNNEQAAKLEGLLKANETWGYTHNCSSWARETVEAVTGKHLDADDPGALWTETPRQLGASIQRLEEKSKTSPESPAVPVPENSSRSKGSSAELSGTSVQLLHDSERHVRHTAEKHGLAWDTGMDNTVAAVALQAREDGLSGITHFKAGNGVIRFAQADGVGIKEGELDARTAANTPANDSKLALETLDARHSGERMHEARSPREATSPAMQLA